MLLRVLLIFTFVLNPVAAISQNAPTIVGTKDSQAVSSALFSLTAMGSGNLIASQTVQAIGTLTLHGTSDVVFPVVLKSRGTQQLRTELTTNKGMRVFIANGGHGIIRQPDGSIRQLSDDNMIVQRVNHIPALSLIAECSQQNVQLDYLGSSQVDGINADILVVSLYSGSTVEEAQSLQKRTRIFYYVDHKAGLIVRMDRVNYAENNPNESQNEETHYSDYRLINGVMVPFQQTTLADGKAYLDLTLTSVTFGLPVSDADFNLE